MREGLGLTVKEPDWLDQPCLTQLGVSAPTMLKWFEDLNRGRLYADQVKPFNFMLVAHLAPTGHPEGTDPKRFVLVSPYSSDTARWRQFHWINRYDGNQYRVEPEHGQRDP
ncbi:MAG: hypothetical protein M1401_18280 [Chloroflexi bacterium]|nr:hypothetical protein [Chloroflexota bacterium]